MSAERWQHISTGHPEVADYYYEIFETIENPRVIYQGEYEGLIAVSLKLKETNKFLVVVYKETGPSDGFVITAYISNKEQKFNKKEVIWKQ